METDVAYGIGALVVLVLIVGAVVALKRRPGRDDKFQAAATAAGFEFEATSPHMLGKVRGDVRGHTIREVNNLVTGEWQHKPIIAFEAVCGIEPDRTVWWVVRVPTDEERNLLTITRTARLLTFIFHGREMQPFTSPELASESDELRRYASRFNFPMKIACDDDVAAVHRLTPHLEFLKTTTEEWIYQGMGAETWVTTPAIGPEDLTGSLDRALALIENVELLRRDWSSGT